MSGGSSDSKAANCNKFDHHMAMVMEKGVVTLAQYLVEHRSELSMADYTQIISSAFNIVNKEAHGKGWVLMDLKGSNIMLFDSGRGGDCESGRASISKDPSQ